MSLLLYWQQNSLHAGAAELNRCIYGIVVAISIIIIAECMIKLFAVCCVHSHTWFDVFWPRIMVFI